MRSPRIQQRDAASLAAGYARSHRVLEVCGIVAFATFGAILAYRLASNIDGHFLLLPSAIFFGFVAADFTSGFVHWFCDTWGSVETPLIGRLFIRTFREHHVDQEAITRHDFIETNGDNCLVAAPLLGASLFIPLGPDQPMMLFAGTFVLSLTVFVFLTSQIHKWSHMRQPPGLIAFLQRCHLILPPEHHARHHTAPFDQHYCITVGWLNVPLARIAFFRRMERFITATTGSLPRQDDIGEAAALVVASENGVIGEAPIADGEAVPASEKPSVGLR